MVLRSLKAAGEKLCRVGNTYRAYCVYSHDLALRELRDGFHSLLPGGNVVHRLCGISFEIKSVPTFIGLSLFKQVCPQRA